MVITAGIAIWGLCQKQTYTNLLSQPEALNMLRVAEFPEALVPTMAEQALKELPESPIIIRATAMAEKDYLFSLNLQKVSVQQVYRGEGIEPGDEVQIALNTKFTINAQTIEGMVADEKIAELHFVNEMEEGKDYLIFLEKKIDPLDKREQQAIYRVVESVITPVFGYEERENKIVDVSKSISTYIDYELVKDNEFFVTSQKTLDGFMELKKQLLAQFPKS
ncbi:MAG TPA: hypothetical protein IAC96_04145 [Candidatus Fimimorpha faecalis]|uniref:Uncharacterized protein n=1 Tax=Candidatus Fimimorpha faecalis TaxID=2840824 RepID=A0A9D1ED37_9FIRM|nr:hypothetical protein [Candidatus Fimimorpha faecalis]